jgi:predicted DNA-binding transcriptional regulator YafY
VAPEARMTLTNEEQKVVIDYTNHRGERRERTITPLAVAYHSSPWHPEPQWLLTAHDEEKGDVRDFALKDVHGWRPANAPRGATHAMLGGYSPAHLARALTWIENHVDANSATTDRGDYRYGGIALVAQALAETAR